MIKKINYPLVETIGVISRSLERYESYAKDTRECTACQELWAKLREAREKELTMLLKELKDHFDAGLVSFES